MEIDEIKIGLKGNYAYLKNITVTGINDKHVIMSDVNGDTKEVFKSLFLKYFKEQHTQKKQHCTQCESKKENPWCTNCKEKDCVVSSDGTCEMIRRYLKPRCYLCKVSEQNLDLIAEVERLKCELHQIKTDNNLYQVKCMNDKCDDAKGCSHSKPHKFIPGVCDYDGCNDGCKVVTK